VAPDAEAHALEAAVQALFDASPDCHASQEGSCAVREAQLAPARPWCQSRGQRVLVIDEISFAYAPFERVLGYYRQDDEGRLVEVTPAVSMQAGLFTALHDLLGQGTYFRPLLRLPALTEKFSYPRPQAHGSLSPARIADLSPLAQLVLVDVGGGPPPSCDEAVIEQRLRNRLASVRELVRRHGIGYVNYSMGDTLASLRSAYQACHPSEAWLRGVLASTVREWYQPLGTMPGVVLVQSAPNGGEASRPLVPNDPDFLADCVALPNRLRVGCASWEGELDLGEVPPEGLDWARYGAAMDPELQALQACVDVYLFARGADCVTSFAAPAALAHLLYLQGARGAAGQPPLDAPALVREAEHQDPPRLIDPADDRLYEADRMFGADLPQVSSGGSSAAAAPARRSSSAPRISRLPSWP
jgi:hypothetical protein